MKIAVSIGHGKSKNGGYDSGAVSADKKHHEYNLANGVGKHLKNILSEYKCDVYIINTKKEMYLYDRINYIKNKGADLALELHLNACNGKATGSECYHKATSKSGKKLAGLISKNISKDMGSNNRGAKTRPISKTDKRDYFGFVREIPCESLLVETLFVDCPTDCDKLVSSDGQRRCAQAIANAIVSFYKLEPKSNKTEPSKKPSEPSKTISVKKGDKVKLIGKKYATGQTIPQWVKNSIHTIKDNPEKTQNGRYRVLLKEINSYVWADEVVFAVEKISANDTVCIVPGAVYGGCGSARGKKIPTEQCEPKKHVIEKIQYNLGVEEARLKGINSWVAVSSLKRMGD